MSDLANTFLRGILASPQLALVAESCASEVFLHKALRAEPFRTLSASELAAIEDADARENYAFYQRLQTEVQAAGGLRAHYWQLIQGEVSVVPPEVMDVMIETLTNDMLDASAAAAIERGAPEKNMAIQYAAAEWFYKRQAVHLEDGRVVHDPARDSVRDPLDLSHGMANEVSNGLLFRLTNANSGLKALSQVMEKWLAYMLADRLKVEVTIKPLPKVDDALWRWHIGLEATSTAILNDLYVSGEVSQERLGQLVSLFKLEFKNPALMQTDVAGKPVYLGLAMDASGQVKIKPHNLLLNLPLA